MIFQTEMSIYISHPFLTNILPAPIKLFAV